MMVVRDLFTSFTVLFLIVSAVLATPYKSLASGEEIHILQEEEIDNGEARQEDMDIKKNSLSLDATISPPSNGIDTEGDSREYSGSYGNILPGESMDRVTSVSKLADIQPTDWAFPALESLAQKYGCLVEYPARFFEGNQKISRYEFGAMLLSCQDSFFNLVTEDDLHTWQRLQAEFATELDALKVRVNSLYTRLNQVKANKFSPTLLMGGQVIFGLAFAEGGKPPGKGETNIVLTHQTQLTTVSSLTGKDRLQFSLATGNFNNLGFANLNSLNTYMGLLNYQTGLANNIILNSLEYRFPIFRDRAVFTIKPVGFSLSDILTANTPYFDSGRGAISRFAAANPVFQIGSLESGLGVDWLMNNQARLQVAYGTQNSANPLGGFLGGNRSALGIQLLLKPNPNLVTGFAYINAYTRDGRLDTLTGSFNADTSGTFLEPAQIHALSATLQWRLSPHTTLGTWGGLIYSNSLESGAFAISATSLVSLGIEDPFGREGDFLSFLIGIPPKLLIGSQIERFDEGTALHIETFYRFRINDYISITPGFFIVTDPGHIPSNNPIFVGTIRTTFRF
ncbi:MAG TPA: S-layer protein [Cyanobacteria bacterium UBA11149]|nr:S-layer protein [Cyanobacteria bacterium UBA11367]HBE58678.1 S-layer protein [Cyanobacteria bacterium UBA11366]HBK65758.1 S-layer protein [Cyanobacteria bacterium UBA11166]HBR77165.1 S-layer protein [Cyanobacteria bacterium UBA11159]HBS69041.1 S-layer protein [Cyanobacteria bacterium UBA11153]HBW88925.1 S-layer protein [Cyanobacteria bacterium UBA11149]HCA97137.1 S-layer protein [Cyanobacteria bacterium UBA9226]